jgi:hypothetical protein
MSNITKLLSNVAFTRFLLCLVNVGTRPFQFFQLKQYLKKSETRFLTRVFHWFEIINVTNLQR